MLTIKSDQHNSYSCLIYRKRRNSKSGDFPPPLPGSTFVSHNLWPVTDSCRTFMQQKNALVLEGSCGSHQLPKAQWVGMLSHMQLFGYVSGPECCSRLALFTSLRWWSLQQGRHWVSIPASSYGSQGHLLIFLSSCPDYLLPHSPWAGFAFQLWWFSNIHPSPWSGPLHSEKQLFLSMASFTSKKLQFFLDLECPWWRGTEGFIIYATHNLLREFPYFVLSWNLKKAAALIQGFILEVGNREELQQYILESPEEILKSATEES